jgi:uncharacterized glyoxalase superfamily protein PhnB
MNPTTIIPVFHVADADVALKFYTQVLGFEQAFRYGTYVGVKRGPCELHLTTPGDYQREPGGGTAYVICDEVDAYYARIKAAGADVKSEPGDRMYGFRDFVVHDPDGNQLSFGRDIEKE